MSECLFCRIAAKTEPAFVVAENEAHVAFLDAYPKASGHTLVIPKAHAAYVFDMEEIAYTALLAFTKQVAQKLKVVAGAERVMMKTIGVDVPHVHIHLLPDRFHLSVSRNDLAAIHAYITQSS